LFAITQFIFGNNYFYYLFFMSNLISLNFSFNSKEKLDTFMNLSQKIWFIIDWTPQVVANIEWGWWGWWTIYWNRWYISWNIQKTKDIKTSYSYFLTLKKELKGKDEENIKKLAEFINTWNLIWEKLLPITSSSTEFNKEFFWKWFLMIALIIVFMIIIENIFKSFWSYMPISPKVFVFSLIIIVWIIQFINWVNISDKVEKTNLKNKSKNEKTKENFIKDLEKYFWIKII
jgi:hypothetical protein